MEIGSCDVNNETMQCESRSFLFCILLVMLSLLLAMSFCLVAFSFRIQISGYFYVVAKSYTSAIYLFSVVTIARIPTTLTTNENNNDNNIDDDNDDKVVR